MNFEQHSFAAVDLGSNSFHMVVARHEDNHLVVLDQLRENIRLAAGLTRKRELTEDARCRAIDCLGKFGQRTRALPAERVRAVGTNTLRRMRKPKEFLAAAEAALGHPIEIISAREEARLIYLAVAHGLAARGQRLVVDIGGGSTECVIGRGYEPIELESASIGCVGISRRFFPDGVIARPAFKAAQTTVALELQPIVARFLEVGWKEVVGSSGTVRAIQRVLAAAGWSGDEIEAGGLKTLRRTIREADHMDALDLPGLADERRAVFPGGVAILSAVFRAFKLDRMRVSESALREGVLYDLIGRAQQEDPREGAVTSFANRYRVDHAQAARVSATALAAFDVVGAAWGLDTGERRQLDWAARLHEVGLAISHSRHHQHGAYLAEHSELAGFSREEQMILATLVRAHRRRLQSRLVDALPDRLVDPVTKICGLLRLSVLLHRSRVARALPPIRWAADEHRVTLTFPAGWLNDHPLTEADLEREGVELGRLGIDLRYG